MPRSWATLAAARGLPRCLVAACNSSRRGFQAGRDLWQTLNGTGIGNWHALLATKAGCGQG
jgi:hypothetical protein